VRGSLEPEFKVGLNNSVRHHLKKQEVKWGEKRGRGRKTERPNSLLLIVAKSE
jgi:hypothetical protein